jgi:hypothetical protein
MTLETASSLAPAALAHCQGSARGAKYRTKLEDGSMTQGTALLQVHECECGLSRAGDGQCERAGCEGNLFPKYQVVNSKGRIVGHVFGFSHEDALESAAQVPQFNKLHAFTVRPAMRRRK